MSLRKLFKPSRGVPYWMLRSWSMKPSVTNKAFLPRQTSEWSTSYIPCELSSTSTSLSLFQSIFRTCSPNPQLRPTVSKLQDSTGDTAAPREMFTSTCNYQWSNPSPLSALDLTPPSSGHSPDVRFSLPLWKSAAVVKDDGEDKQHGGSRGSLQERVGSPVVLLERPFIRCWSCWAIYFSILLAMSLSYGLADLWAQEMGCLSISSGELDLFSLAGDSARTITNPRPSLERGGMSQTIVDLALGFTPAKEGAACGK